MISDSFDNTVRTDIGGSEVSGALNGITTMESTRRDINIQDFNHIPSSEDFMLNGVVYRNIKCLSDNSGEAQVFLVANGLKHYVLKVYYPNFSVDKKLLKILTNMNFEMIVHVFDYGKTYVNGKSRNYELMEYLKGGTFVDCFKVNDEDEFRRIALQCAAALEYCHNNNIIHKDIKPSNFFFRDKNKTEVVLGDFGISSVLENNKSVLRTSQARTPVYAAPEMYTDVIDGEVEITSAADFYSLGITLMTLWLGENPLNSNERLIIRKKNEGRLPGLNELPERIKLLIQGLTIVNPSKRWGYNEVEKWFIGETPEIDLSSPYLRYKSFVFDPENNVVADNVHELIPLMIENETIACNYLYNGQIVKWLEQCGNNKLSVAVNDIITNKYPANHKAGLWAAVYTMESTYPYKDIKGNICDDIHSIAISLITYADEYTLMLRNPLDSLWIYLESHGNYNIERLRDYFDVSKCVVDRKSIMKLVYEIDSDIPFLSKYPSSSVKEIVKSFGVYNLTDDEWQSVTDGRLLAWMYSHEQKLACESLKILTDGKDHSRQLAYKVFYNIDRDAAYDLKEASTPKEIGDLLSEKLCQWQSLNDDEFADKIKDFSDIKGRFSYYAQLHGWYSLISEASKCFNIKSKVNKERYCAYDLRTAAYRFCKFLGSDPVYALSDGMQLTDGCDIDKKYTSKIRTELRTSCFAQWMSVFYHENPNADFSEDYSYERSLEKWIYALGNIDPQQKYYKRYENAKKNTLEKNEELRRNLYKLNLRETLFRIAFFVISAFWIVTLFMYGIGSIDYFLANSLFTIALPVGGASAVILGTRLYFKGYGFLMCIILGFLGLLSSLIPIWMLKIVHQSVPSLFIPAIVAITLFYMFICYITDFRNSNHSEKKIINDLLEDDVKSNLLEPLYYTFKTKSNKYNSSKFRLVDDIQNQIRTVASEKTSHYILWCLMALIVLAEMFLFNANLLNLPNPDFEHWHKNPSEIVDYSQFEH